jgi:hypothetical protein
MPDRPFSVSESFDVALRPPRSEEIDARTLYRQRISAPVGLVNWQPLAPRELAPLVPAFEVIRLIGRGGMGAVYQARQLSLDRPVALKVLPLEMLMEENFGERFAREARTMGRLNHPRIVGVYDFGHTAHGHPYIVMEYVEGPALTSLIEARRLEPTAALQVLRDVCKGLGYAHEHGVVHRDLKPSNVLLETDGRAKLADFGLARLTSTEESGQATRSLFGTPAYMAPEQVDGREADHRADIYAFGMMLYELLCHQVPRGEMPPPSTQVPVDPRVDRIFTKAIQNSPEKRYQSVREVLEDLTEITRPTVPVAVAPPAKAVALAKAEPGMTRRTALWRSVAACAVVLTGGVGAWPLITRAARSKGRDGLPGNPPGSGGAIKPANRIRNGGFSAMNEAQDPEAWEVVKGRGFCALENGVSFLRMTGGSESETAALQYVQIPAGMRKARISVRVVSDDFQTARHGDYGMILVQRTAPGEPALVRSLCTINERTAEWREIFAEIDLLERVSFLLLKLRIYGAAAPATVDFTDVRLEVY